VIGLTPQEAIQELVNAGFLWAEVYRGNGNGLVVQYSPAGQAPRGSTVTFYCQ
jgi:hypothetical protein